MDNKIICVPGNHDCNFGIDDNARKMLLASLRSNAGMVDNSVYDVISAVQNDFKEFAKNAMIDKGFILSINNNVTVNVGDKTILFRLYNTAWMSSLKEEQNSIVMPLEMINSESIDADLVISLFHHNYSWITPSCDDNKNRFRKHIMKTSNMVLYGHEHTPSSSQVMDHYESEIVNEIEGGALCFSRSGCTRASSFNSIILDLDLKQEIIKPTEQIDPEKEREKILKRRDENERLVSNEKVNPNSLPIEIQNMNKSLRSIEVVGQIVKNRQGSLPKPDIKTMVMEMYGAAFRTIGYFGAIIESEREHVVEDVINNKNEGASNNEIIKKIDSFFELTSLNFCLFVFSKVINAVGSKELRSTFSQIAEEIGTPAAKLVSFSIISCFSKIAIPELEDLVEDLRDNPVAMSIIRARVRSYLYNNHVNFSDRQKIINTVNLNPRDSHIVANKPSRKSR